MKTNVVSIPSTTSLAEARRIMDAHKIRRLPVIDKTHLEGIVTIDDLDRMGLIMHLETMRFGRCVAGSQETGV